MILVRDDVDRHIQKCSELHLLRVRIGWSHHDGDVDRAAEKGGLEQLVQFFVHADTDIRADMGRWVNGQLSSITAGLRLLPGLFSSEKKCLRRYPTQTVPMLRRP